MESNQIELSFLSIFTLVTFFIFLIISKYSYKIKKGILLDQDFLKPQAFHKAAIGRARGVSWSHLFKYFFYYLLFNLFKNFI